ncbi:MAG: hypothetical protein QGG40_06750 [Myxococcota bacterium]|nr:hypothetical protein [Myxococcota bacterium]
MRRALGLIVFASIIGAYGSPAEATCQTYKVSWSGSNGQKIWMLTSKRDIKPHDGTKIIQEQAKSSHGNSASVYYSGGSGGTNECTPGHKSSADRVIAR